ncbi:MAG: AsnC family transcriptional regulator [Deltaproteobacteria bacterium]|nr:AsnC family transcriptional regulator [Deltaproteobacteria bacterium]
MDDIDKKILNEIQSCFPITERPYKYLGDKLNCTEDEIFLRVKRLIKDGIIRRIGGSFSPKKLGFVSTLCAAKVPEDKIEKFVEVVNKYSGVTHNYFRDHEYNIWFTFIAPDMKLIKNHISQIGRSTGVNDILNLPSLKAYKILVDFHIS